MEVLPEVRAPLLGRTFDPHRVGTEVLDARRGRAIPGLWRAGQTFRPEQAERRPSAPVEADVERVHPRRLVVGQDVEAAGVRERVSS